MYVPKFRCDSDRQYHPGREDTESPKKNNWLLARVDLSGGIAVSVTAYKWDDNLAQEAGIKHCCSIDCFAEIVENEFFPKAKAAPKAQPEKTDALDEPAVGEETPI
jgi:hypothetical protein